jgi:hypothetical protein
VTTLYDCIASGQRYMTTADMLQEAQLLGLNSQTRLEDLWAELKRRGLYTIRKGAFVKRADA